MSKVSDNFEKLICEVIDNKHGVSATRPNQGVHYSDIKINIGDKNSWLEVKMSDTDNLANPRVFYNGEQWDTTSKLEVSTFAVDLLNNSNDASMFVDNIKQYTNQTVVKLKTSYGKTQLEGCITNQTLKEYFSQPTMNRYVCQIPNIDIGTLITNHYTQNKHEPAHYIQVGESFYMIGNDNPLNLDANIPTFNGFGWFNVRVATRSKFYEIQAEIKIVGLVESAWSVFGNKKNPFNKLS